MSTKISKRMEIAAGIVPVRKFGDQYLFLMVRSNDFWEFPKGKQEEGENVFDTAIRETCEETTLTPDNLDFRWGKVSQQTDRYKKGKKYVVYFIAVTNTENVACPPNPQLGYPEHQEIRWVTYKEAKDLANKRIGKIIDWANRVINSYA